MYNKLLILCGIPGSGKSTWAENFQKRIGKENCKIVSRDQIRFSLLDENDDYFTKEKEVFSKFCKQIQDELDSGVKYVIADATHSNKKARETLIRNLHIYSIDIIPVEFNTTLEQCLINNNFREGRSCVPEKTIVEMYNRCENPSLSEFPYAKILHVWNRRR